MRMKWFWAELHRLSPRTICYFAAVWQLRGARACLHEAFELQYEQGIAEGQSEEAMTDLSPQSRMAALDHEYRRQRRMVWVSLLGIGAVLTFQPWLDVQWFSSVILLAGIMLCALEFSPRAEPGFVALVHRVLGTREKK